MDKGSQIMGNGASQRAGSTITIDGDKIEVARLKMLYPELREQMKRKDEMIKEKNQQIAAFEQEIINLKKEINQLKSVLDITNAKQQDGFESIKEEPESEDTHFGAKVDSKMKFINVVAKVRNKRFAVSAESSSTSPSNVELQKVPKNSDAKKLIGDAIRRNKFLKHLEGHQVKEIVMCMYLKHFEKGEYIIKEGDSGNALFVVKKGETEVSQGTKILGKPMGPGELFGELAILYNCTRTASVRALEPTEVWTIERSVFQAVMKKTGTMRREEDSEFLKSTEVFKSFSDEQLFKIADVVEEEFFPDYEYIIREGETGDSFFIIKSGTVKVFQLLEGHDEPQEIRELKEGDYFGERALLSEDVRSASIVAQKDGATCLVIERESFMSFIGDLSELKDKDYGDEKRKAVAATRTNSLIQDTKTCDTIRPEFQNVRLTDYLPIATLGMGGFGRVELVQDKNKRDKTYALKSLVKKHIVETKQQEHVYNEKKILLSLESPFIIQLYKTFKDERYVYLLMEVCLGGELWTILRDRDYFDENTTKFYIACVTEAFDYLHQRGIIYRDLKPENLLMDNSGYIKLVDFGFAKKIRSSGKTWTFCGTPEYVAPEIILNKGHDCSADYWSLGILIYELMTGNPPFSSSDAMNTYNIILRGIDALEFSPLITRNAQAIIKKLCKESPSERLGNQKDGINGIRKHKWFQGFHWAGVSNRTLKPPIIPKVKNQLDSSNFDKFGSQKDVPPIESSGWDKDF